ncbi:hypothetical protein [Acuticoccus mangrovi]|uniref:Uncharacterized protein n=1 Tax=Acuticoccus mangrovi TaxID=2796142 RepID=A0A934IEB9_9HYPH|nr:hypothetical protein [Acuticoccus mangrovi]MBJ3775024.1 hypothetical protein [Acuticoccus mangrovi]
MTRLVAFALTTGIAVGLLAIAGSPAGAALLGGGSKTLARPGLLVVQNPRHSGYPGPNIDPDPGPFTPSRHCRSEVVEVVDPDTGEIVLETIRVCPRPRL